ncbi:hypothetical protein CRYUN_Cryun03dG0033300 [Craigia yunnanensis]
MEGAVLVFDFDKTIIECDSDYWVVEEFGVTELFTQLRPTLPWNTLMDRTIIRVQSRGNTIDDIADCLRRVSLHPKIVSVTTIFVCVMRIISDANVFFIKTILKNHGLLDCFSEINTNPSYVDGEGRLRTSPYHDFESSSHGCNICPPNMCKGLIMERVQASVSATGKKSVGADLQQYKLIRANIHEWNDGKEFGTVLSNLINKIFSEENCFMGVNQIVPVDCKFQTSSVYPPEAFRNALPVPH